MSTSFLGLKLDSSTVIPSVAAVLGIFNIANGAYSLSSPADAAANFGLVKSSPVVVSARQNPFIAVVAGRAIASGLGMLGLAYFRYDRAIGLLLAVGIVTGTIDGITLLRHVETATEKSVPDGRRLQKAQQAAAGHIGITAACSAFGLWILLKT